MRHSLISAAVAAAIASTSANAAVVDLYVSGSSAARDFFQADMKTSICGGVAAAAFTTSSPDNKALRCVAVVPTSGSLPTNIIAGDVVTVHYSAELGSLWGVSPFLANYTDGSSVTHFRTTQRLFVNPDGLDCPGGTGVAGANLGAGGACTVSTYSNKTETFTSPNNDSLVRATPDVGVSDQDFEQFSLPDNWVQVQDATPANNYTALDWYHLVAGVPVYDQAPPSLAQLHALGTSANAKYINGQVFSVIVNNGGPAAAKGNLSKQSLSSIFTGRYSTWGQVPEVGGSNATQIKVCRRDHGSGTQVTASIYFTGTECGLAGAQRFVSQTAGNGLGTNGGSSLGVANVQEDVSTGNVRTCVTGTPGAIGVTSLGINTASYTTLNIDGVQPNAHNAAAGFYDFAAEDWGYDNSANTQGATSAAHYLWNTLYTNARKAANLFVFKPETGSQQASGQWLVNEGGGDTRSGYFALPITLVNNPTVSSWKSITAESVGTGTVSGHNCQVRLNINSAL